jgi:hypothetical protein
MSWHNIPIGADTQRQYADSGRTLRAGQRER